MNAFAIFLTFFSFSMVDCYFPIGKCWQTDVIGSPYVLTWNLIDNNAGKFCFVVNNILGVESPCADLFRSLTKKIVIKSNPLCKNSNIQVFIDNVKKGGGVYFDLYGSDEAELRITSMNYTNNTIEGRTFCIVAKEPCNNLNALCSGNSCTYSIYDPADHECCPVSTITPTFTWNSPPPPQQQQSPPPPPPQSPPPACSIGNMSIGDLNCLCTCTISNN